MYNKLDIHCIDEESVKDDIKVTLKIFSSNAQVKHAEDEFKINSGSSLKDTKDLFQEKVEKKLMKSSNLIKWDIDGVWSYVDQKIDILVNDYSKEEPIMSIQKNKVIPMFTNKGGKNKYFGEFTKNGELYVVAKHKFIGA